MQNHNITIIDFGCGNLHSIKRSFERLKVKVLISSKVEDFRKADKLILPGVGQFSFGMEMLKKMNFIEELNELVLIKKKPILGICLGMQLMTKHGAEGNVGGLGWFDANTKRFEVSDNQQYKVPHVGFNNLKIKNEGQILKDIIEEDYFYFVHSYHVECVSTCDIAAITDYDYPFTSVIEKENIIGVQFHPEKSFETGEKIFNNFLNL